MCDGASDWRCLWCYDRAELGGVAGGGGLNLAPIKSEEKTLPAGLKLPFASATTSHGWNDCWLGFVSTTIMFTVSPGWKPVPCEIDIGVWRVIFAIGGEGRLVVRAHPGPRRLVALRRRCAAVSQIKYLRGERFVQLGRNVRPILRRAALSAAVRSAVSGWPVCGLRLVGRNTGVSAAGYRRVTCVSAGRRWRTAAVHRRRKPSLARLKRLVTAPRTGRCLVFGCVELVYSYFSNCCGVSGGTAEKLNGATRSDIEGKVARVAMRECGSDRVSNAESHLSSLTS